MTDAEPRELHSSELSEQLRAGAWPALETVYRALASEVWRFAYERLSRDRHAADEVTSRVFLAVVEHARRFDPAQATIEGWVFGIARHKLADHLRQVYRERRRLKLLKEQIYIDAPVPAVDSVADTLRLTLDRIDPTQRQLLLWKYRDGLSTRRIAQRLQRSEKACENLLYRARNRFKVLYAQVMEAQAQ